MTADSPDPLGKRALFWAPANRVEEQALPAKQPVVAGKYALFSSGLPDSDDERQGARGAGLVPPVEVRCSSCGAEREVDVVGYLPCTCRSSCGVPAVASADS